MQAKKAPPKLNMLKFPIYSVEVFNDFVFLGGGGGYEIANKIQVYKMAQGTKVLKDMVHEEATGNEVCCCMYTARDVSTLMVDD